MEEKRRKLDREIRAAKRAQVKQEKEALLSSRQDLGVWLAVSVGAERPETVELLKLALDADRVRQHLAREIGTTVPDTFGAAAELVEAESADTSAPDSGALVPPPSDGRFGSEASP
ncbi:hypothetical protein [Nesterenkonia lutea]|uniref:Beta-phosphoglucomutase-like phosphatase (HAD superfamily) n=1 Tax=Nesterenkonia lutea TaxID=272919 RepID=A0ABR9JEU6_9MICC|nr:hypothetical protein [Nesterenkonia lutea]MBE1524293.1 beta-phosphoglucomutase-like phosphatase (HAD superfamily) [Nesterenkonia lutea]